MATSAPTLALARISTERCWAVHRQMDAWHRQALLAIIGPESGEVILDDGDLVWHTRSGLDVLFTIVHVPHVDYVRAMQRSTSRRWSTTYDRPVRLDDRDDIARQVSHLMEVMRAGSVYMAATMVDVAGGDENRG
ncbi:hypothetical protein GS491_26580 [Rhodococcus hoagii]|nr:hypothetical protein [Prescottella equi]NKR80687.1 hypothetical protein [Prescottella equi]NKS99567.1 hypothetical protein [Prescottella equi]